MGKFYRIGLDIGIGSVGWAVLENDPTTEEPNRILKLGVRTFSPNEEDKTGESTAKSRREKRGLHRRTRRRSFRMQRLKSLISQTFNIDVEKELQNILNCDVYKLRATALDEKKSYAEIAKIILNLAKHRGFQSNRKSGAMGEDGTLLTAIKENSRFLEDNGYRTIGEAFYKDARFSAEVNGKRVYNTRNHGGDYKNCFARTDLIAEMELILNKQREFGNLQINDEFIEKVIYIFSKQRNFDEGPGEPSPYSAKFEIGKCTFLGNEGELRAPKASFTFEYFNALSKINSLRVNDKDLTLEQKQILYDCALKNKELKFDKVRKLLNIENNQTFNLCRYTANKNKDDSEPLTEEQIIADCEKKSVMFKMENSNKIAKALELDSLIENKDLINEVALMLTTCKSDAKIDEYISNSVILNELSDQQKENLKGLNFDKVGSLSIKAMEKIIPYLEKGERYDVACKNAGFNHSSFEHEKFKYLKGEFVEERLADVTSNVVKRAVNQSLRIINEIIKEYGSPQFVTIELARELSKDFQERNKIKKAQEQNFVLNENAKEQLAEKFKLSKVTHFDLIKYRLYEEQCGKCIYSGKEIDINRLYEPNYVQVDHILPYSRSMNDSYSNKVLVLTSENQNKRNQTPYEWFGSDSEKWNSFTSRVNLLKNREKRRFLLKENFGEEQSKDFIERNLNDTKYMARFMLNLIQDYLQMCPSKKYKKVVRSVNGAVTSYLRKFWGINKIREDGDVHHAIDAAVIATATDGQVQKITKYNELKEKFKRNEKELKLIDKETGEVISIKDIQEFEKFGVDVFSKYLPTPYDDFIKELEIRSRTNYNTLDFTDEEKLELAKLGYDNDEIAQAKPIFVSRMKTVKTTGAIHKETMMSAREYAETKMLIKSTNLSSLKLKETAELIPLKDDKYPECSIENYYRPESDRLLYLKLKEYLKENGSIPEKIEFHKPKKDGTDGPVVKTVKVYEKSSNCVITPNGAAANDKMHRVDVFEKDGKFYLCPIYMADVYAKTLPNKVIERDKDWSEIDESYNFKFSLYQNDLIKITNNKDITLKKNFTNEKSKKPNEIKNKEFIIYFNSLNISNGAIDIKSHDNAYINTIGVKTLPNIEKYYVDIMGKLYKAPNEERKGF